MNFIGIVYFVVVLVACIWGAVVGLGGGVFIRPIFDVIGYHNVLNIQFISSSAIITMAIISTIKKVKDNVKIEAGTAVLVSLGAAVGGILGNLLLEYLLSVFDMEVTFQRVQMAATVVVLSISLVLTVKANLRYEIKSRGLSALLGVFLGVVAVFLGIGGGPINVPLLMIFFGFPIKQAAAYSIVIIFFSHLSRVIIMSFTVGYSYFDLRMLAFTIPAAAIGGLVGAKFSKIFSDATVKKLFIVAILSVIGLNIFNGIFL